MKSLAHASTSLDNIFCKAIGAYSNRTISGYRNDLEHFSKWCGDERLDWLPSTPGTLARYIEVQSTACAFATIKRRVEAIKFAHRMLDLPSPAASSDVRLALRRVSRARAIRPKQAQGMTHRVLQQIISACSDTLAGKRDAALVSLGYDSLARSYELAQLDVAHLADDLASVLIPMAKTDHAGEGRLAYLSPQTQVLLQEWLSESGLTKGPLFQALHTRKLSGKPLETSSIRRLIKRAAARAGLDGEMAKDLSGHSMRVGAAQDMMLAGLDHIAIMQAGGWKTVDVVARYVENAAARNLHQRRWASIGRG